MDILINELPCNETSYHYVWFLQEIKIFINRMAELLFLKLFLSIFCLYSSDVEVPHWMNT